MKRRRVGIIGVTGSIGKQAVDVVLRNKDLFEVVFISAHSNKTLLEQTKNLLGAKHAVLTHNGMGELLSIINDSEIDVALVASSGTQVLQAAYLLASKRIILALANKECIVSAGRQITSMAAQSGTTIVPVDSEHSAIFQSLVGHSIDDVYKITLTASGGAFRDCSTEQLQDVTLADALNHPNWSMGQKITIDSATMMNKGLELIEARFLFNVPPDKLDVVIHPQSIIHSVVSYTDGSTIGQMGLPDMRTPISYALGYPDRIASGVGHMDFTKSFGLTFYPPDYDKYRCLKIAMEILHNDRSAGMIVMNAANEIAVDAFLSGRIKFLDIADIVESSLMKSDFNEPTSIEDVLHIDLSARRLALGFIK